MANTFIDTDIITAFEKKESPFDYTKLISLLSSLNLNYKKQDQYTCSVLIRSIVDITPPLLGLSSFNDVVSNYSWSQSNSKYMKMLLDFKNDGDSTLHAQISEDKDFLDIDKITVFRNIINVLLQECLKKGSINELKKSNELRKKNRKPEPKIIVDLVEEKNDGWQNYGIGFYTGYSFKFILNVDNFNNSKPDYLKACLQAKDSFGEKWETNYFIFETKKPEQNLPYRINEGEELKVSVFLSDQEFSHNPQGHRFKPNLDKDTLVLLVSTKSGIDFKFPIHANII